VGGGRAAARAAGRAGAGAGRAAAAVGAAGPLPTVVWRHHEVGAQAAHGAQRVGGAAVHELRAHVHHVHRLAKGGRAKLQRAHLRRESGGGAVGLARQQQQSQA
jgi:hypothetical protein